MIFRQAETAACLLCAEIWRRETADLTDRLNCIVTWEKKFLLAVK